MTNRTLRMCPPSLRTETLRAFERRLQAFSREATECAEIAQQLDLAPLIGELREIHIQIEATRLAVVGAAR